MEEDDREELAEFLSNPDPRGVHDRLRACLEAPHYWSFRRSVGQLAIVNIGYGLLAGVLAEQTKGIVVSYDSAWDWAQMPYLPEAFLLEYFNAEKTKDADCKRWATRCIGALPAGPGRALRVK